jgi:hypothetical protein
METHAIIPGTLELSSPWQITQVDFSTESNCLDISVEIVGGERQACPVCGAQGTICYLNPETETWRFNDFLRYTTYLHARVPHLVCRCGVVPMELPWRRAGSRFARVS